MLSDEDKAKIREKEEIKMEVRQNARKNQCCFRRHCGRYHWLAGFGIVVLLLIVMGAFCHHSKDYHYTHIPESHSEQIASE